MRKNSKAYMELWKKVREALEAQLVTKEENLSIHEGWLCPYDEKSANWMLDDLATVAMHTIIDEQRKSKK